MTNSIWKTPDQKPEKNKLIFAQHDRHRDGNIDYFIWDIHEFRDVIRKDSIRWCYLDELLAQADKAERLQKALCFIRNIRGAGMSYQDMFLDAHEVAKTALDPEYKPVLCGRYDEEMVDLIKQLGENQ